MSGNGTLTTVPDGVSVLVTTVCVLALCCCLHATSRCLINSFAFLPPGRSSLNPGPIRYGPSDATVWLRNAYGTELAAILYSPPLSANNSGIYILFSHGNAEDIGGRDSDLRRMARDLACHILSYDYSGYGHSKGKPGAAAMYADSEAALSYLLNERGVNPDRLLVFGVSLGTVPSGEMPIWNSLHACGQLGRSTRITLCFSPQLLSPSTLFFSIDSVKLVSSNPTACAGLILQSPLASGARVLFPVSAQRAFIVAQFLNWSVLLFCSFLSQLPTIAFAWLGPPQYIILGSPLLLH